MAALNRILRLDVRPRNMTSLEQANAAFYQLELSPDYMDNDVTAVFDRLIDPLMEEYFLQGAGEESLPFSLAVEVMSKKGVTDNTAKALGEAFQILGMKVVVSSGVVYYTRSEFSQTMARQWVIGKGANPLVHDITVRALGDIQLNKLAPPERTSAQSVQYLPLNIAATGLLQVSKQNGLGLSLEECQVISEYFTNNTVQKERRLQGLPESMSDVELELLAQSWSEHCKHKIFQAQIDYNGPEGESKIDGLFKTFIKGATEQIIKSKKIDWAISLFKDNAGIVRFDSKVDVCLKVETHNSPSALDPYGGAMTGILGVNRDILGTGMGAKPIANIDVFCLPHEEWQKAMDKYPARVATPDQLLSGVHHGVQDGGNKSGIPTVNGSMYFDFSYAAKPLIYVGTLGVIPQTINGKKTSEKCAQKGDLIVIAGGSVGKDGIHGATFSSMALDQDSPTSAVQIGDPLTQKRVLDFVLEARNSLLYTSITDNGAGGISSSVGEMSQQSNGAMIELDKNLLKYPGLKPWEILVSESQERMTLAVPTENYPALSKLAIKHGVSIYQIGHFTDTGRLDIFYQKKIVASLPLDFIHEKNPRMKLKALWNKSDSWLLDCQTLPRLKKRSWEKLKENWGQEHWHNLVQAMLRGMNIASKEKWVERYDSEVQGATLTRPFEGRDACGPSDAAVMGLEIYGGEKESAVAMAHGMCPGLMIIDPALSAAWAVDEAVRSVVISGGDPDTIALLDNFCWPDPLPGTTNEKASEVKLGALVRACQGLADTAQLYSSPLISGKDSMKNDYKGPACDGESVHYWVKPTLLVTSLARMQRDHRTTVSFKQSSDVVYVLNDSARGTLLASEFSNLVEVPQNMQDQSGLSMPDEKRRTFFGVLHEMIREKMLVSAHDVSDGGVLTACLESAFASNFGLKFELDFDVLDPARFMTWAFSEHSGAIVVSIKQEHARGLEERMHGFVCQRVAVVTESAKVTIHGGGSILETALCELSESWKRQDWFKGEMK